MGHGLFSPYVNRCFIANHFQAFQSILFKIFIGNNGNKWVTVVPQCVFYLAEFHDNLFVIHAHGEFHDNLFVIHAHGEFHDNLFVIHAHGLSQQGVWVPFWTPKPLKSTPQDPRKFCEKFLKMSI